MSYLPEYPIFIGSFDGQRVLVLEDDPFLADDLNELLTDRHADVLGPFSHLCDADSALRAGKDPDFAILDIKLVDGNAYPIARWLSERNIPFVFATAYAVDDLPPEFRHAALIQKPYRMASIVEASSHLLGRRPGPIDASRSGGAGLRKSADDSA